ncbi:MAG: peptidase M61 [Cyclobacteriaceae bacterium]
MSRQLPNSPFLLTIQKSLILLTLFTAVSLSAIGQSGYQVDIDLNNVIDDKVKVTVKVPPIEAAEIEYHIPKIVPGTYTIYDFGRFISDFHAYDKDRNELPVDSLTANRRLIKEANKLVELSYLVEDTYDTDKGNFVFEPAGSNIEVNKVFILNNYAFIGYLKGYKDLPYTVKIKHPAKLFGTTSLTKQGHTDSLDTYTASNYFQLSDGPIMYSKPDTTSFEIGGANIMVSVYSPTDSSRSELLSWYIQETLEAQAAYLNHQMPVDHYTFLIYHFPGIFSGSLAHGALEHSYSSLYSLPDLHPILISQTIKDFVAHEFFHIVTPLNIHSEEIENFDFIEPKMSKHLWLYEGVTEYAAGLAQVKYGQMDMQQYLELLLKKTRSSLNYNDDLPFTELSLGCLDEYKSQYGNVYVKGALIGLCLDILLRQYSGGTYGIQELMTDLSKKYGKNKSFSDDELFDVITEMTYPQIRDFFKKHVEGSEKLPLEQVFDAVGLRLTQESERNELSLGNIGFSAKSKENNLLITDTSDLNKFGRELGYWEGDILYKFDGVKVTAENFEMVFEKFRRNHSEGDMIEVEVLRKNNKKKHKKVTLKGKAIMGISKISWSLAPLSNASQDQLTLRKAWINK